MEKTKLGISTALLASLTYFAALSFGYTPLFILVGYVLIFESDTWLKRSTVKAAAIVLVSAALMEVLGIIPGAINCISNILSIFNGSFSIAFINKLVTSLNTIIGYCRDLALLVLGICALLKINISIPFIDSFVSKHIQ